MASQASAYSLPPSYPAYSSLAVDDMEKGNFHYEASSFAERQVRNGFIRKVFGILALQLTLTSLVAAPLVLSTTAKQFVAANSWVLSIAMMGSLALILVLSLSESARQSHPTNLILLFSFTTFEGILVGAASAQYDTDIVLAALAMTAGITTGLTLYALRTKKDFTASGALLLSCLLALIFAGFMGLFLRSSAFNLLMSGLGALLFACYIVYDVQLLVGGDHQMKLSPDEYVMGAIAIYLDIINLFLYILRLLNSMRHD